MKIVNEIYVTGCVIPNGLPDHENDVLDKQDIKKIFTKYINRDTDTMHTRIKNEGVEVLANWISEVDTKIKDKIAPAGSWLCTFKISNEEIIQSILDPSEDSINGISLGSVSDVALTQRYWFINKSITYSDLDDTEEVIPLFISFVDKPSNMFGLEVEEYEVYINKRVNEEKTMTDIENTNEEKLSLTGWERVIKALGINKSINEKVVEIDEVEINKTEEKEEKTEPSDISNTELLEKIPEAVATGITNAFEAMKPNEEVKKVAIDKNIDEDNKDEEEEEPTQKEEVEEVEINKRATEKEEEITIPQTNNNFYKKSGRDMYGRRIK